MQVYNFLCFLFWISANRKLCYKFLVFGIYVKLSNVIKSHNKEMNSEDLIEKILLQAWTEPSP